MRAEMLLQLMLPQLILSHCGPVSALSSLNYFSQIFVTAIRKITNKSLKSKEGRRDLELSISYTNRVAVEAISNR